MAINCTFVPVSFNEDHEESILRNMRLFGITTPEDDNKVMYKTKEYYCIPFSHVFDVASVDDEEAIKRETKNLIKTNYMKICSFAFLFNIGNECVRDKYNRLIPTDLSSQDKSQILQNNNGMYSPKLVKNITDDVYARLDKMEEYEILTSDQKWDLINKYQEQLDRDDLIIEEPLGNTCCCCGSLCNPCSQTCGACPRNGRLMMWAMERGIQPELEENFMETNTALGYI